MVRLLSALICAIVIWQLFRLNREKEIPASKALWVPTVWLFFGATRNPAEWFHLSGGEQSGGRYMEGSPLDQIALSAMLAIGLAVLFSRGKRVVAILQSNFPVILYFLYCGLSIIWSDFPEVASKRWLRAAGDVVMVLVVLSDPNWTAAIRRLFARVSFIAMPVSVLFIRYFPEYGRAYSRGGASSWTGVANGKNGLGLICLVFGLACLYRFLEVLREEKTARRKKFLIAQGVILAMTLYLLFEAHSATSTASFVLACIPLVLTHFFRFARKPLIVHAIVIVLLGLTISSLFLNVNTGMVEQLGRDSTLTGRTDIWKSAFSLVQNPITGTGFESFWIGPRLTKMESLIQQTVNQAHNGYIEVYLNLGWVGIILLSIFLFSAYLRVLRALRLRLPLASLSLGFFIAVTTYNCAEAGIKMMSPLWIAILLVAMIVPDLAVQDSSSPEPLSFNRPKQLANSGKKRTPSKVMAPTGAKAELQESAGQGISSYLFRPSCFLRN
jgi:exopolysaccharide production protein ExoQ